MQASYAGERLQVALLSRLPLEGASAVRLNGDGAEDGGAVAYCAADGGAEVGNGNGNAAHAVLEWKGRRIALYSAHLSVRCASEVRSRRKTCPRRAPIFLAGEHCAPSPRTLRPEPSTLAAHLSTHGLRPRGVRSPAACAVCAGASVGGALHSRARRRAAGPRRRPGVRRLRRAAPAAHQDGASIPSPPSGWC